MDTSRFLAGFVFVLLTGIVGAVVWWNAGTRDRARRTAERRWPIDKRAHYTRGLTKDEWLDEYARSEPRSARWFFLPLIGLFMLLGLGVMVSAFFH